MQPSFVRTSQDNNFSGIVCRYNHSDMMLLGSTDSGTLRLAVDATGLDYEVSLPECRADVWEMVQRKDIRHSSFAFAVTSDGWSRDDDGYPLRHLVSGKIVDVAPVTLAAYPDSSVALRSFARYFDIDAPIEDAEEYAERDELRKFLPHSRSRVRPGLPKRRTWQQAQVELMAIRWSPEPVKPKSLKQIQTETMGMRWSPPRPKTTHQKIVETEGMRWPELKG